MCSETAIQKLRDGWDGPPSGRSDLDKFQIRRHKEVKGWIREQQGTQQPSTPHVGHELTSTSSPAAREHGPIQNQANNYTAPSGLETFPLNPTGELAFPSHHHAHKISKRMMQ